MHIPDGFLSTPVWATMDAIAVPAIGWVASRAKSAEESRAPLLGMLGAFVFAAQMINFPIAPGTSAHLLGGALLACTVGPAAGIIVLTAVLVIQAFVFQDGGLLAMGANVFNLAFVGSVAGYLPCALLHQRWRAGGLFFGGLLSVVASGCCALIQLLSSGVSMPPALVSGALGLFVFSGVVEGAITVAVVGAIEKINPGWIRPAESKPAQRLLAGAAVALAAFGFLVASGSPDSLESVAERLGIAGRETQLFSSPLANYHWQGFPVALLARAAAGVIGLAAVYVAIVLVGRALRRAHDRTAPHQQESALTPDGRLECASTPKR